MPHTLNNPTNYTLNKSNANKTKNIPNETKPKKPTHLAIKIPNREPSCSKSLTSSKSLREGFDPFSLMCSYSISTNFLKMKCLPLPLLNLTPDVAPKSISHEHPSKVGGSVSNIFGRQRSKGDLSILIQ